MLGVEALLIAVIVGLKPAILDYPHGLNGIVLAGIPALFFGGSGVLYRRARLASQSRWMALFPSAMATLWAALGVAALAGMAWDFPVSLEWVHGFGAGGFLLSLLVMAASGRPRPRKADSASAHPSPQKMSAVVESLLLAMEREPAAASAIALLRECAQVKWKGAGDAGEELAGALMALDGVIDQNDSPSSSALEDGIEVIQRAFERVNKAAS